MNGPTGQLPQRSQNFKYWQRDFWTFRSNATVLSLMIIVAFSRMGLAQTANATRTNLADASLEDLMNIQVTSVSKKEQTLSKTAAAVFVIDKEDIHRSGATNIPDLLRMAPGVDVAQIDGGHWAISIRGFSDVYGDKVLVLIDGRSVYNETFSGVTWEAMDMPLEDIERIEVIRGPGGTVWGANAVNGVINIITKSAKATQGGLLSADASSRTNAGGLVQYGGKIGSAGTYRVFDKYFNIAPAVPAGQLPALDGSHGFHEGFRSDWDLSPRDSLTVEGDVLQTEGGATSVNAVIANALPFVTKTIPDEIRYASGSIVGLWNHTMANGSDMSLEINDERHVWRSQGIRESSNSFDVDFHHHLAIGTRQDVVWGFDFRTVQASFVPGVSITIASPASPSNLYSVFVQDEIKIADSLSLTLGSKLEHNSYTGFEYEPSAQLTWAVTDRHTLWASAARAIRQPAQLDVGLEADAAVVPLGNGAAGIVEQFGTPNVQAEKLLDFELGHRAQINSHLSVDSVVFLSSYRNLGAFEPGNPFFTVSDGPPHVAIPLILDYKAYAHDYGAEVFATWTAAHRWKLIPEFSVLHMNEVDPTGQKVLLVDPGNSPRHSFGVRSLLNLGHNLHWDASLSSVGAITNTPGYTRVDTRLGWRLGESIEVSLVGQNLLTPRHAEYPDQYGIGHTLVGRTVFLKTTWRF